MNEKTCRPSTASSRASNAWRMTGTTLLSSASPWQFGSIRSVRGPALFAGRFAARRASAPRPGRFRHRRPDSVAESGVAPNLGFPAQTPPGGHQPQLLATESDIAVSQIKIPKTDAVAPVLRTNAVRFLRGDSARQSHAAGRDLDWDSALVQGGPGVATCPDPGEARLATGEVRPVLRLATRQAGPGDLGGGVGVESTGVSGGLSSSCEEWG